MGTAMTVRIAEGLKNEARDYGKREGLTINALIVVALREYLERRRAAGGLEGPAAIPTMTTRAERAEGPPVELAAAAGGLEGPAAIPTMTTRAERAEGPPVELAAAIAKEVRRGERVMGLGISGARKGKKARRR